MTETNFMKLYERLSNLNDDGSLTEKWHNSEDHNGRVWFSDSAIQFKNFMQSLSSSGMQGVRLIVAPDFYLAANALDLNHDMMLEIAEKELYLDVPHPRACEFYTCGIPKCTDFDLGNSYETGSENNYQGVLVADYGTFELSLYHFTSKTCPEYTANHKYPYFEDSETYRALKPLLKRIYIYGA